MSTAPRTEEPDNGAERTRPSLGALGRTIRPARGLPSSRAAVGGLLIAVAAIGTWVAATGGNRDATTRDVVTRQRIAAGTVLAERDLGVIKVELPERLRATAFDDPSTLVGAVTRGPLGSGELVQSGAVTAGGVPVHGAELSFAVDPRWAVAGDIEIGDRVTVYATDDDGVTTAVLEAVPVLRVTSVDDGLGSNGTQTITVAAGDAVELDDVVASTRTADITVVRVSGADARPPRTPPSTAAPRTRSTTSTTPPTAGNGRAAPREESGR